MIGKDGGYTFEDGFNNIKVPVEFRIIKNNTLLRRRLISQIAAWLQGTGELILGIEPDVAYEAKVLGGVSSAAVFYQDSFVVTFDCKPLKKSIYQNDELTWDGTDFPWDSADIDLGGALVEYEDVNSGDTLTPVNFGTYKALPIVVLSGTATSLSMTDSAGNSFTYSNLNGTIYIDCEEMVVYSESGGVKTNQINNFSGDFIEIIPGENEIDVTGTGFSGVDIRIDYRNTYL